MALSDCPRCWDTPYTCAKAAPDDRRCSTCNKVVPIDEPSIWDGVVFLCETCWAAKCQQKAIIIPSSCQQTGHGGFDTFLMDLYDKYPHLRHRADRIHESRMMTPPACPDCVRMAIMQILDLF